MEVGLHSYSRRKAFESDSYGALSFLNEARDWGFRAVEIMTGKAGSPPEHIDDDSVESLRRVCQAARERELRVACWSTYNDFSFTPNEAWRLANIEYIKTWIVKAAESEVPNLRLLTGYAPKGEDQAKLEQLVIDATKQCARLAEKHGVNLALENHSTVFLYAEDIARLQSAVGSPRLTTCPDPTNGFDVMEDPASLQRVYENLERLAPRATNAHLKVFGVDGDRLLGFDVDRIVGTLAKAGYAGPIQLELVDADADPAILPRARELVSAAIERASAPLSSAG